MNLDWISQINLAQETNKTDALLKTLINLITAKTLPAGYVFPNENVMCEHLSIGRGTLREVYKVLEQRGFITRSKAGTSVNNIENLARNGTFDTSLLMSEIDNLIEFLLIVEPEAAALAAKKRTDEELEKIYKTMMDLEHMNQLKNYDKERELNALFHQYVREASHNSVLVSSISSSRKYFEEKIIHPLINDSIASQQFMDVCLVQHYNLYYALKTKDENQARKIMHDHFITDLEYIKKNEEESE